MMQKKKYYIAAGSVILLVFLVYAIVNNRSAAQKQKRPNIVLVKVEKPLTRDFDVSLKYTGDISAVQMANIYSKVSGNIEKLYSDIGSAVRTNQLLAVIDSTELRQQYQLAAASYYNSKSNYQRSKLLFQQNLVARQELENNEAAYKIAEANYDNARTRLGYCRIRSPFSGFITKRFLDRGALVQTNNSILFTLMKTDSVKVIVNVQEKHIPFIGKGRKAVVSVDALPQKKFYGVIGRVGQALDLATRTLPVEINILNKTFELKPGMFADIAIMMDTHKNVLVVPNDAVLKDKKGEYIFVLEDGKAKRIDVKTGLDQDNFIEIISGLSGSEDVITTGQQFVRNGATVKQM